MKPQRASTKPEGFHTPRETPWEINTLRVNSSGRNHLLPLSLLLAVTTLCTSVLCDSTINLHTDFSTIKCVLYFINPAAIMLTAS